MPYSKQTWADLPATTSALSAARLNVIEAGIESAARPDLVAFTPPDTSWTAFNSGVVTTGTDSRLITLASSSGDNWKGELRTLSPTSNYTATFYFDWTHPGVSNSGAGVILKNSGSGNMVTFAAYFQSGLGDFMLRATGWTSATAYSFDYTTRATTLLSNGMPNWFRVRDDNTTRFLEYSYNGADWVTFHSVARLDFITTAPDRIGWAANSNNTGGSYTTITRLRHYTLV